MNISKIKRTLFTISAGIIIGLIITTGIFIFKNSVHGKLPPGTKISNINVSYKTPEEAKKILEQESKKYLETPIEITLDNKKILLTPKQLGVEILTDETVQIINEINAKQLSLWDMFTFKNNPPTTINILIKIDHKKAISRISNGFKLKEFEPKSAIFYFDENGNLSIKKEKEGKILDEEELITTLKNSAKQLESNKINIKLKASPPQITLSQLEPKKEEISNMLFQGIVFMDPIYSDDWTIRLIDHIDWIDFTEKEKLTIEGLKSATTEKYIAVEINLDKLNIFIDEEISKWLDKPSEPVNIYTDENKKIIIEGKGSDGLKIQRELFKKSIELAIENGIKEIPIPVLKISPTIAISEDLQDLGIKEIIGIGHTSYYNSPANRVHNIKTAAEKHNGTLIAPDEIFSFNENLGPVDGSTGYKKELVIKEEGTIPEYGGGVCQVSTTMYRAALFSGLPIVERNEHSYAVSYYSQILGHGLDATIYLGGADLKFLNDTGKSILIQAYVENEYELYFVFYGTSDGREVEMDGPYLSNYHNPGPTIYQDDPSLPVGTTKQIEKSHTGFNALWYRSITDAEGNVTEEEISTHYRAIPAKILVGTGGTETAE